jgi:hypothetical protein
MRNMRWLTARCKRCETAAGILSTHRRSRFSSTTLGRFGERFFATRERLPVDVDGVYASSDSLSDDDDDESLD